jgi:ribosome-interacting GTPase 1
MASTNQSPQYQKTEANFLAAKTNKDKIYWLEEMIKECPKHKSSEKMLANLKTRRKKLLEKIESAKKMSRSSGRAGIKKEDMQAIILGKTNSGKSSLLSLLTNAQAVISPIVFSTKQPVIGIMDYNGVLIQLIEVPAIESEYYDKGLVNTADTILILINEIGDLNDIEKSLQNVRGNKIVLFNIKDNIDKRKLEATLKSKRINSIIINTKTKENIEQLKEIIFSSFGKIRIFTKEPGKEKSKKPMIFNPNSIVGDVAKKVLKNLSEIKQTKIWGPSSKFPGQIVGLQHKLKDLCVVEFKTR